MSSMIVLNQDDCTGMFPLSLVIQREGVGGVAGAHPTVALRLVPTSGFYWDFVDNTFKGSSWTLKNAPLTDLGGGFYERQLSLGAVGAAIGGFIAIMAEYFVSDPGVVGVDNDLLVFTDTHLVSQVTTISVDTTLLKKALTNRMEQTSGTPGYLVLYDDDGSTVLYRWQLRDEAGGGIIGIQGASARRSAGALGP